LLHVWGFIGCGISTYNNVTVQRRVSLDTQQCWTALAWLADDNVNK
jgi:hypothetical protein